MRGRGASRFAGIGRKRNQMTGKRPIREVRRVFNQIDVVRPEALEGGVEEMKTAAFVLD